MLTGIFLLALVFAGPCRSFHRPTQPSPSPGHADGGQQNNSGQDMGNQALDSKSQPLSIHSEDRCIFKVP